MSVKLNWYGQEAIKMIQEGGMEGCVSALEHLKAQTHPDVPKDTHALAQSAEVSADGKTRAVLSYNTPYAVVQHENLGYNHPNGGKAKYLEDQFNQNKDSMKQIIASTIGQKL